MADDGNRKREQVLPPGTYAFIQDGTKGSIKTHAGPVTLTLTAQDKPVKYDTRSHGFEEVGLDAAVMKNVVAPEGYYVVLTNPAKSKDGKDLHPELGRPSDAPDLLIGQKENIPGPVDFALYPGQTAEVRRGHHLRSNEYLRVKVYNEEKARDNWSKAVVKTTEIAPAVGADGKPISAAKAEAPLATSKAPKDLAVGKQYNILGTEVSFYIPPTGVSVVPEGAEFVRDAETLEQLEYAILVDEDGNKEYPRGPAVVFPRPTQKFLTDREGNRKFRAIEMNELQGIQLKFIDDVTLKYADGKEEKHGAGEEVFVTGARMPIYYPEEGHQLVKYDGKTIHYAVAIPEGEARYVMNRKNGEIRTVTGPTMLLPNPVHEIIVRRALSDLESSTWFPGADGNGSKDALEYNRFLRNQAAKEPTTRQGVVSDARVETQGFMGIAASGIPMSMAMMDSFNLGDGFGKIDEISAVYASGSPNALANAASERSGPVKKRAASSKMEESRQGKNQDAIVGDVAERKSTYNEPRSLTIASKYKGVPTIKIQQGYAIQVSDASGKRMVIAGPKTVLLKYGETLDLLALSTGKPKTTDKLHRTAYLNIANNKVADIIEVETADLVKLDVKLVYDVNFEGEAAKWFAIENYVKHLCDRVRSALKGQIRKLTIEAFYSNSTDLLRNAILGGPVAQKEGGVTKREGWNFAENGMRISDVEVLSVSIKDPQIGAMMAAAQHQAVKQNIEVAQAKSRLEATRQSLEIQRATWQEEFVTTKAKTNLDGQTVAEQLKLELSRLAANLQVEAEVRKKKEADDALAGFLHTQALARDEETKILDERFALAEQERQIAVIRAQTDAIVAQMKAVDPTLAAALDSASARDTLVQVAGKLGFHQMFGGENAADFLGKAFAGTPLSGLINKALDKAARSQNGSAASVA